MLSFAPTPIFGASSTASWDTRPAVSSPLSSSPVRASSPLSPIDKNTLFQRQTQSSPLQPSKSKFASRPTRPNPLVRRREDAQEARRSNFLQSVRKKAEDKAWQRRDIEGHFLKNSWLSDKAQLSRDAPTISDADIEDATMYREEQPPQSMDDDMMMDEGPPDDDIEAMVASYAQDASTSQRPPSPEFSDDDYDDIFTDFMSQEQAPRSQGASQPEPSDEMQLSQDMMF